MQTRLFVEACKRERDSLLLASVDPLGRSAVAQTLNIASLSAEQRTRVEAALDMVLTDTFYTILLALNGSASLGGIQQSYRIFAQDGGLVSEDDDGDLESYAFAIFQQPPAPDQEV